MKSKKTLSFEYENNWGLVKVSDIQLIIDDYTWLGRASYDGCEKYNLKTHPLLSAFENQEFHLGSI